MNNRKNVKTKRITSHGIHHVGRSRVPVETVITAFVDGASAEEIQAQYPVVGLPDIYAVIAWFLNNRHSADAYLTRRGIEMANVRKACESLFPATGLRRRLLVRTRRGSHLPTIQAA